MIDKDKLPEDAMIDTGVLMRFLGDQPQDPRAPLCRAFCEEMVKLGRKLWVAAPTIAELVRHRGKPIPLVKGIVAVPFDRQAADILGQRLPMQSLKKVKGISGNSLSYYKYDALIMACAVRAKTRTFITLDLQDHKLLAEHLDIKVCEPDQFSLTDFTRTSPVEVLDDPMHF
jgi:predicted nucleic acid-binding protein